MDISSLVEVEPNPNIPEISPGDTVRVKFKGAATGRERAQVFAGTVIRVRRSGAGTNFTVRQLFHGVGVERTFPLYSPLLEQVEVLSHGKVRRAKLYYLRGLSRKKARLKVKAKAKG
jgi:large subunit ribosomal protein L19